MIEYGSRFCQNFVILLSLYEGISSGNIQQIKSNQSYRYILKKLKCCLMLNIVDTKYYYRRFNFQLKGDKFVLLVLMVW